MKKKKQGSLFIITGCSGAGKDTVIELLRKKIKFAWVITTTTRARRAGEKQGKPYYFTTRTNFKKMRAKNKFLEWAEVYGNFYGATKKEVENKLNKNKIVVLKTDYQGAKTIKNKLPRAKTIFIKPESIKRLKERLLKRGTDSLEIIKKRLVIAKKEMKNLKIWNYIVINAEEKADQAAQEIMKIIKSS